MADLELNKPGVEHQNVSQNDCDDDSLPECFILSEPLQDPYDSDILENEKKEIKNESEKSRKDDFSGSYYHMGTKSKSDNKIKDPHLNIFSDSSKLSQTIIDNSIKPSYDTHGSDFTQSENPTLAECLEELLDFALEENPERRTLIDGRKLFDDKTTDEIIQFWTEYHPKMEWLFENFSYDIGMESTVPEDIINNIGVSKKWESKKDFEKLRLQVQGLQFVKDFLELLQMLGTYDAESSECSSKDELHDIFKHVVPLIANFLEISHKSIGQCKLKIPIVEVSESYNEVGLFEKSHLVIAMPDIVLKSLDEELMFPVQVYAPTFSPKKKGEGIPGDLDTSQSKRCERKFQTQHMVQHIGLLLNKMISLPKPVNIDNPNISVGMFLTRGIINFSKVNTTVRYASSFSKYLFFSQMSTTILSNASKQGWDFNSNKFAQEMLKLMQDNSKKNGLLVSKSRWHIDLCKSLHRNALFIFLLHYFDAYM